jgi:hypothetical protein
MSKFTMTLLAAAAAAVVATAVVALPAIGDSGTNGAQLTDESALAGCLAAHGLAGAPTTGPELKAWLADKQGAGPDSVKAAIDACVHGASAPGPDIQHMISCVRSHGIDAPTAPEDFKRWVGERPQAGASKALDDAVIACKRALAPAANLGAPGKPDCGAPAEKPGRPQTSQSSPHRRATPTASDRGAQRPRSHTRARMSSLRCPRVPLLVCRC